MPGGTFPDQMARNNEKTTSAAEFGQRLRAAMQERGHGSSSSRSRVDVGALARAAGTTYEMARRYAEGGAVPRADKLRAIAVWLGVSPSVLLWGDAPGVPNVNLGVLESCIAAVADAQRRTGLNISTERAARVVALLYQEAVAGKLTAPEVVDLLVRS